MARRPSFQFYPADWRGNTKLRLATMADRGLWLEVMCLLHDSDEYGILRCDLDRIAAAVPCHVNSLRTLVSQRIMKGAPAGDQSEAVIYVDSKRQSHTVLPPQPGPIWFSSRMLVDEFRSQQNKANGGKGGNPALVPKNDAAVKQGVNPRGYPSSSSSSSTSLSPPKPPAGGRERPRRSRKRAANAAAVAKTLGLSEVPT